MYGCWQVDERRIKITTQVIIQDNGKIQIKLDRPDERDLFGVVVADEANSERGDKEMWLAFSLTPTEALSLINRIGIALVQIQRSNTDGGSKQS